MPKAIAKAQKATTTVPVADGCEQICYNAPLVTALKAQMLTNDTVHDWAATFEILADPTRIRIIHALSQGELCVCDLAHVLKMSMSAISHQLRRLRDLRLVKFRYEGRMSFYSLDDAFTKRMLREAVAHVSR